MKRVFERERQESIITFNLDYPKPCPHCGTWMNNAPAASTHLAKKHNDYSTVTKEEDKPEKSSIQRCNNCYAEVESAKGRCGSCGINPSVMVGRRKERPF